MTQTSTTTRRQTLRAMFLGAIVCSVAVGCAKKKQAADDKSGKSEPVAGKTDGTKKSGLPKVAGKDTSPAKKSTVTPPEKKIARKAEPKPKQPVVKAKPKKKSEEPVSIDKVSTRAEALAVIKQLNPEISYNLSDEVLKLNFEYTEVTDQHLSLLKYFPSLGSLDLTGTAITDKGLAYFNKKDFPHLFQLNLSHTKITDAGVAHLKGLQRLSELYLYNTPLTDAGMKYLSGLVRLEHLCLDKTRITDKGLPALKDLEDLQVLHIRSRNKITDAGLAHLVGLKRLRQLHLQGTDFTADGVQALRRALPKCDVEWDHTPAGKDGKRDVPRKKGAVP